MVDAMADVHLHVGPVKTGSAYLQNLLWSHRDDLARQGVLLPLEHANEMWLAVNDVQDGAFIKTPWRQPERMVIAEVLAVLRSLDAAGVRYSLEGGWGVDALIGHQTRPHRDLDIDVDAAQESLVLDVLGELGYVIETDWRPNRVELVAPGRGRVDLHPLQIADDGSARQAALDGGHHEFPASYFTVGRLGGCTVRCVTREAQIAFHEGYELRPVDRHDLEILEAVRGIRTPGTPEPTNRGSGRPGCPETSHGGGGGI